MDNQVTMESIKEILREQIKLSRMEGVRSGRQALAYDLFILIRAGRMDMVMAHVQEELQLDIEDVKS